LKIFFYSQNKIRYVLHLTQLFVYVMINLLLTTSFSLKRPSSGQYVQKTSNARPYSTNKKVKQTSILSFL